MKDRELAFSLFGADPVRRAVRILRGCLSQVAAELTEHECENCGSVHTGGTCGTVEESQWAAGMVDQTDGLQILARAIWHLTPTRKLHLRIRGENVHPALFMWEDPALFLEKGFDRFAPFGGE